MLIRSCLTKALFFNKVSSKYFLKIGTNTYRNILNLVLCTGLCEFLKITFHVFFICIFYGIGKNIDLISGFEINKFARRVIKIKIEFCFIVNDMKQYNFVFVVLQMLQRVEKRFFTSRLEHIGENN